MIPEYRVNPVSCEGKPRASGDDPVAIVPIEFGIM